LEPTSIDEYIAEHKAGDTVSGRLVECTQKQIKVELGEGVVAKCRRPVESKPEERGQEPAAKADITSLTAMLSAKWKQGGSTSKAAGREAMRAGQIRSFRIALLDPSSKQIELELAD
jgi:small subunit ribosomal protein S1